MSAPNCVPTFILPKSCDPFKNCSVSTTKCVQTQDGERIYLADISPIVLMSNKVCNEEETNWPHYMARERNLWLAHFRTFCELVEGEENKLTIFSTWTIMLGCDESNIIFQSANLGNSGEAMVEIHKYSVKQ